MNLTYKIVYKQNITLVDKNSKYSGPRLMQRRLLQRRLLQIVDVA